MRQVIKATISERKDRQPEFNIQVGGSESELSYALAKSFEMFISQTAKFNGKSFEQTKKDYLQAIEVVISNIHNTENK
ncbi:hypothetical protein KQ805_03060 [Listeria monocytogenes]|uniref:Uncharacterized protein n=1 Tax=Listeria monocytogenes TaxID=1639 RepID=A0AAN2ZWT2_LISMN|nr:hypothetical protein [Listeria monocytogenes]EAE2639904.1 hypothetical protein [Listeria monocytogenes]EAE2658409.1 hypothetical protein [Listeria monocytogenes]EAE6098984.1 hypothetical protein [Listeria monocytogenes]EAG7471352.1 hypothetical protein [Listeria monocytogenes]EAG8858326.1 hypothetical protein [Listeria monocytogenes]